eukprot:6190526-Pleurochrysis_carterae.AAC.2
MPPWGGTIVDEPCPIEARLAVYSPCGISSSLMSKPLTPGHDNNSGPFYMDPRYGYFVSGQSCGVYYGRKRTVYGSLCTRIYHSVRAPLSVLSYFLFAERTHYEHPFNTPFITPYWVVGMIGPYDGDSLPDASPNTRSHFRITNACGRVLAGKSIPSMADLAVNVCHAHFQAIDACHGLPHSEYYFNH